MAHDDDLGFDPELGAELNDLNHALIGVSAGVLERARAGVDEERYVIVLYVHDTQEQATVIASTSIDVAQVRAMMEQASMAVGGTPAIVPRDPREEP